MANNDDKKPGGFKEGFKAGVEDAKDKDDE